MVLNRETVQALIAQGQAIEQIAAQATYLWDPTPIDLEQHRKMVWTMADLDGHWAAFLGKRRWT